MEGQAEVAHDAAEPEGNRPRKLDLQEGRPLGEDGGAVAAQGQIQIVAAGEDVGVEGQTEGGILLAVVGIAHIADVDPRLHRLVGAVVVDLTEHLLVDVGQPFGVDARVEVVLEVAVAQFGSALGAHAVVFLFQLQEHLGVLGGNAVAAEAELFLVLGELDRAADDVIVKIVVVEIADHVGLAVDVEGVVVHVGGDPRLQLLHPLGGQGGLFFHALEGIGHTASFPPDRVFGWSDKFDKTKSNRIYLLYREYVTRF